MKNFVFTLFTVACTLNALLGEAIISDDFQQDNIGPIHRRTHSGAQILGSAPKEYIAIADAASTPPDPFDSPGNKSLMVSKHEKADLAIPRISWRFDPLFSGKIAFRLYALEAEGYQNAFFRIYLTSPRASGSNGTNEHIALGVGWDGNKLQIVSRDGEKGVVHSVTEPEVFSYNIPYLFEITFDDDSFSVTIDGVQLIANGESKWPFRSPRPEGVTRLEFAVAASNRGGCVFIDDLKITPR